MAAGCASVPEPLKQVGTAAGNLGTAVAGATRAGVAAVREAATTKPDTAGTQAPATTGGKKDELAKAKITWDAKFASGFKAQSSIEAQTSVRVWRSPDEGIIRVSAKPSNPKSTAKEMAVFAQVSMTSCNRTLAGAGSLALSATTSTLGGMATVAANNNPITSQVSRVTGSGASSSSAATQPTTATASVASLTGAFAGLTPAQKVACEGDIATTKIAFQTKAQELLKNFSAADKAVVTYSSTNGADIVLGLTIPRAPAVK